MARTTRRTWTTEEDTALRTALAEGATWKEVGAELGRSPMSCRARMDRIGGRTNGPPPRSNTRTDTLVVEYVVRGLSIRAMSRVMGVVDTVTRKKLKRLVRLGIVVRTDAPQGSRKKPCYVVAGWWVRARDRATTEHREGRHFGKRGSPEPGASPSR